MKRFSLSDVKGAPREIFQAVRIVLVILTKRAKEKFTSATRKQDRKPRGHSHTTAYLLDDAPDTIHAELMNGLQNALGQTYVTAGTSFVSILSERQPEASVEARPFCVVVRTTTVNAVVLLFAITSQIPDDERLSLPISEIECGRAGLDFPCWIILDEYNRVELDHVLDFETTVPLGILSPAFFQRIARTIEDAAASRKLAAMHPS